MVDFIDYYVGKAGMLPGFAINLGV